MYILDICLSKNLPNVITKLPSTRIFRLVGRPSPLYEASLYEVFPIYKVMPGKGNNKDQLRKWSKRSNRG